jgi:hypothetical protein
VGSTVRPAKRERAGSVAAIYADLGETEEDEGRAGSAAHQHERHAVEPVRIIIEPWSGRARGQLDLVQVVPAVESEVPEALAHDGIAAGIRELAKKDFGNGIEGIDRAIAEILGDRTAVERTHGRGRRRCVVGGASRCRDDRHGVVQVGKNGGGVISQRECRHDHRVKVAGRGRGKTSCDDEDKEAREDIARPSVEGSS